MEGSGRDPIQGMSRNFPGGTQKNHETPQSG
jgi:hypothetical protein